VNLAERKQQNMAGQDLPENLPHSKKDNARTDHLPRLSVTLASQSPARLATLRAAGIEPQIRVSGVDESAVIARVRGGATQQVLALAAEKARAVGAHGVPSDLVLGCDSMFEFGGTVVGKPHSAQVALARLRAMAGQAGILHTGHYLLHARSGHAIGAVSHATVHVAQMSEAEIDAYVESGEPLEVAGSFTVDGLGGPFIEKVDGDYHGVVGLSLPLLRTMMHASGLSITQLWASASPAAGKLSAAGSHFLDDAHPMRLLHGADGFLLCSCGQRHWGLNGAAGICAFRTVAHSDTANPRTEILLQLRSPWSHGGGTWGIPGGAVDWEESADEGALREFEEETAIGAESLHPMAHHVADHGDWAYTTMVARCAPNAVAVPDRESQQLAWCDIDALPHNLLPSFAQAWPAVRALVIEAAARGDAR
jgi:septum formation protein